MTPYFRNFNHMPGDLHHISSARSPSTIIKHKIHISVSTFRILLMGCPIIAAKLMAMAVKNDFRPLLLGKDLRSIARANTVVKAVTDQEAFDDLFKLVLHHDRLLVMRAADAVVKITAHHPAFLLPHKSQLFELLKGALNKELKWHLALLITRIPLTSEELRDVWTDLNYWLQNANESKIVRVNALQGLFDLSTQYPGMEQHFLEALNGVRHERIPSLRARIRKLEKKVKKRSV